MQNSSPIQNVSPIQSRSGAWLARWRALRRRLIAEAGGPAELAAIRLAVNQGFVLTPLQARQAGVADACVRRLVRRGTWQSVRYGVLAVVSEEAWSCDGLDQYELDRRDHVLRCSAVALARPNHVVAGRSAAILLGLPVRQTPRDPIVNARDVRGSGPRSGALIRRVTLRPHDEWRWFGVLVTTPARTIVDLARLDRGDGIMAADAALRERVTTPDLLSEATRWSYGWPGVRSARLVVAFADPLAESPLESLVRLALHESKLPPPESQVEITVGPDRRRYRVDFLWRRQRLILEADGRDKYIADELWQEKQRELALTRAGYRIERVIWADLGRNWPLVETRLRRALSLPPTS
jgi:hypothetical protein